MRKRFFVSLVLISFMGFLGWCCLSCGGTFTSNINWLKSYSSALEKAKNDNKPLMIYVSGAFCHWCRKMEKEVYSKPEIEELSKKFICVKLDAQKDIKDLAQYKIMGVPTIIFLKADSTLEEKQSGYLPAPKLAEKMKRYSEVVD